MKKYFTLIITFVSINLIGQEMNLEIIPKPQKIDIESTKHFTYPKSLEIYFNHSEVKKHKIIMSVFTNSIANPIQFSFNEGKSAVIQYNLIENFSEEDLIPVEFIDEAYTLEINENKIIAEAKTLKGLYYASLTLSQIVINNKNKNLPVLKIVDYPNMKFRGISDDVSRGQVSTLENFKRIIKFISEYKMNTYMPYMEDIIKFEKYPEIGVGRGALTKDEIREIVKYANEHFVEVIPIFQTLGHYENILSQPEFIQYADWTGAASLDVTNPQIYEFLENLLIEVFELFPSKYFHMGADESYDVGLGNSRKLVEESSLADIHAEHYKRIYDLCKKHDKEVMMYGDIILSHPEILEKIPKEIIIVDWHYFPKFNYPSTKIFKDADFNFIVSPTVWNFNSAFPENFFAIPNIQTIINDGINQNSIGMINSSWGDYGSETFREYNLYGYAYSAQCAWNINKSELNTFNNSFFKQFFGINSNTANDIYQEFNEPAQQLLWNNIWRHPLLDYRKPDWRQYNLPQTSKYFAMKSSDTLLKNINDLRKTAFKNIDFIDLLEFTAKLKNWFVLKQETQIFLHSLFDSNKADTDKVIDLIEKNIEQLKYLKTQYSNLWNKYNREDNLWMIEDKFDRMITYFKETMQKIKSNKLESPLIKSDWIYYPNDENEFIWKVEFMQKLNINKNIKSAKMQIIGDTFAKLIINGDNVDSVYTKRSGSLWIEQQRIKIINIAKFLKSGENEIIIEAKNYYDKKTPGINIASEILTDADTIIFSTDENWKVRNFEEEEWINAEVIQNPLEIIAPNFNTNRKSWIER